MDNSVVIIGLFLFVMTIVIVGTLYYWRKARSITNTDNTSTHLMADIQQMLDKKGK